MNNPILSRCFGFLLLVTLFAINASSQIADPIVRNRIDSLDSATKRRIDALTQQVQTEDSTTRKTLVDSLSAFKESVIKSSCKFDGKVEGWENWLLVFSPVIAFLLLLTVFLLGGMKGFDMKAAMSESHYPKIIVKNDQYSPTNIATLKDFNDLASVLPPTIEVSIHPLNNTTLITSPPASPPGAATTAKAEVPPPHPSISRYIAFITSLLTLVIAVCITCFFIHHYIRTGCAPEIGGVSTILLALGIGVLPYAVNKVSGAIQKNKTE